MKGSSLAEERVRRPGVTLALVAVALLYGVRPLLEAALFHRLDATADEALIPGGITISVWTSVEGAVGGVMLILCALTWIGRPPRIRWALIGAMIALTAVNLFRIIQAWGTTPDPVFGGQVQSALRNVLLCQFPLMVLVPLYVVWYRTAPQRAFSGRHPSGKPATPRRLHPARMAHPRGQRRVNTALTRG